MPLRPLSAPRRRSQSASGLRVPVVVTTGLTVAAAVPVLALVHAGLGRPLGCIDVALCDARRPDWLPAVTARWQPTPVVQADAFRTLLWLVGALALLLLAAGVVNLVTLVLARASARRAEIAMRVVLGAGRRRVLGQLLREAARLLAPAALAGLGVAAAGAALLRRGWPGESPPWGEPSHGWAAAVVLGVLGAAALLAWTSPAAIAWRRGLRPLVSSADRATAGPGEVLVRNALAALQVGGALVLLIAAGLLLRSAATPPDRAGLGFDPSGIAALRLRLPDGTATSPAGRALALDGVERRVRALPGVVDTSVSSVGSWVGLGVTDRVTTLCVECFIGTMSKPTSTGAARIHAVGPGYFGAMRTAVLRGREFAARDGAGGERIVVINRTFAYRLFPNGDPLGKRVQLGGSRGGWHRVVGVVDDVRAAGIGATSQPSPSLYLPIAQHPPHEVGLAVRTSGPPMQAVPAIAAAIRRAAPGATLSDPRTMPGYLARFAAPLGWLAGLMGALAAVVLLLAVSGVYGVMSYNVLRRTREIGVRMALGARPGDVVRLVLGQSLRLTGVGAVLGVIVAGGVARLLHLMFHGVRPWDPALIGALLALFTALALVASARPAAAAAAVDPQRSLRSE